jgi:hypothetical protein
MQKLEESTKLIAFPFRIEELLDLGLDLNTVYCLQCIKEGLTPGSSSKIEGWIQTLVRKGYISSSLAITSSGEQLLIDLAEGKKNLAFEKNLETHRQMLGFDEWWAAFPKNDSFTHKGKEFIGDRGLRIKRVACKQKFETIVAGGKFTAEQLINALKYEINAKKEQSVKTGQNKLSYMKSTESYLNGGCYENFVEIAEKQKNSPISTNTNITGGFSI